ncbi:hypothetical protein DPEC_G00378890 [Dallia pectoralis]|nr:hypothetical protein DPEC_G00378890 [Dallia pectoralis]
MEARGSRSPPSHCYGDRDCSHPARGLQSPVMEARGSQSRGRKAHGAHSHLLSPGAAVTCYGGGLLSVMEARAAITCYEGRAHSHGMRPETHDHLMEARDS